MALRSKAGGMLLPMRVWDAPIRLLHWAIVLLLLVSYVSINLADGKQALLWMRIHLLSGETMLALLLFRVAWGVIGSETARFSHFLRSPMVAIRTLAAFTKRTPDTQVGHNAAGGWMTVILLLLLAFQVGTGLGSNDDGSTEGPLARLVGKANSDTLSSLHATSFNILLAAAGLHVLAVILYRVVKGQNLLRPMITGKKRLPAATPAPRMASPVLAIVTLAVAAGVTVLISRL